MEWKNIEVEMDSLMAVQMIKGPIDHFHSLTGLVEDVKGSLEEPGSSIQHVIRENNKAVDKLAKLGANQFGEMVVMDDYPTELVPILMADLEQFVFLV